MTETDPAAPIVLDDSWEQRDEAEERSWTDTESELEPCACYSCGGQCGGTNTPGACGPLADVAGVPICEVCREAADAFADDDSNRLGVHAAADSGRVMIEAGVFSARSHRLWMQPAMARRLAAVIVQMAEDAEKQ